MWFELGGKLVNLDQYKEIYVTKNQFGGKCIVVDGDVYPIKNADKLFAEIKKKLIGKDR